MRRLNILAIFSLFVCGGCQDEKILIIRHKVDKPYEEVFNAVRGMAIDSGFILVGEKGKSMTFVKEINLKVDSEKECEEKEQIDTAKVIQLVVSIDEGSYLLAAIQNVDFLEVDKLGKETKFSELKGRNFTIGQEIRKMEEESEEREMILNLILKVSDALDAPQRFEIVNLSSLSEEEKQLFGN